MLWRLWQRLLLTHCVCSGVGEASFQCIVPPFIDDQAPPVRGLVVVESCTVCLSHPCPAPKQKSRGMYLATFFLAIPVGECMPKTTCWGREAQPLLTVFPPLSPGYALGFAFGALVASHLGWRACFFIELVAMAPFAIMLPFLPDHAKR